MSTMTLSSTPLHQPRQALRAVRPAPARSELRLTRRGRLVVFVLSLVLVLGSALFLGAASTATDRPGTDVPTEIITVGTGDTLWEIAGERAATGSDIREVMVQIERLNALESAALDAGQRLRVPLAD